MQPLTRSLFACVVTGFLAMSTGCGGQSSAPVAVDGPSMDTLRIAAERERDKLRELVQRAVSTGSDSDAALDSLEKDYPELYKPVLTVSKDKLSSQILRAVKAIGELGPTARGAAPALIHAAKRKYPDGREIND